MLGAKRIVHFAKEEIKQVKREIRRVTKEKADAQANSSQLLANFQQAENDYDSAMHLAEEKDVDIDTAKAAADHASKQHDFEVEFASYAKESADSAMQQAVVNTSEYLEAAARDDSKKIAASYKDRSGLILDGILHRNPDVVQDNYRYTQVSQVPDNDDDDEHVNAPAAPHSDDADLPSIKAQAGDDLWTTGAINVKGAVAHLMDGAQDAMQQWAKVRFDYKQKDDRQAQSAANVNRDTMNYALRQEMAKIVSEV